MCDLPLMYLLPVLEVVRAKGIFGALVPVPAMAPLEPVSAVLPISLKVVVGALLPLGVVWDVTPGVEGKVFLKIS